MKTKCIILLLSLANGIAIKAMKSPNLPEESSLSKLDQQYIDKAIAECKEIDVNKILTDIKNDNDRTDKNILAENLKKFKDSQTVLWSTDPIKYKYRVGKPIVISTKQPDGSKKRFLKYNIKTAEIPLKFGVYKRDTMDAALLAGNVAAEHYFNKYIIGIRVNKIVEHIIENIEDTESFLIQVSNILENKEKEYTTSIEGKGYFERNKLYAKYLQEIAKTKEIFETYSKKIVGNSYIKSLPIILGRLLINRATDHLERSYIIPDYEHAFTEGSFAFNRGENGNLVENQAPPIPMIAIAKAVIHPKLFLQSLNRNLEAATEGYTKVCTGGIKLPDFNIFKIFSKLSRLPIPDWAWDDKFKKVASLGIDVGIEAFSLKLFNDYCTQQWSNFLGTNYKELLVIIKEYKNAKEQNSADLETLKEAEIKIRKFVDTAHDPSWSSNIKHWYTRFSIDNTATKKLKTWFIYGVAGIAAWKAWSLYKSF